MKLLSAVTPAIGAVTLALCSSFSFAIETPETLFKLGISGSPELLKFDEQGNLFQVQSKTLSKVTAEGTQLWSVWFDGKTQDYSFDNQGNAYVTENKFITYLRTDVGKIFKVDASGQKTQIFPGLYSETGFGARPLLEHNDQSELYLGIGRDIFKFGTDDVQIWNAKISHHSRYGLTDIETDHLGNIYASYFSVAYAPQGVAYGTKLYKFDANGVQQWVHHLPYRIGAGAIHINSQNELVIISTDDKLIHKLNGDGTEIATATYHIGLQTHRLDNQDNLVLAGSGGGGFAISRFDSALVAEWTANRLFIQPGGYNFGATVIAMDIDANNNIYVTGNAQTWTHWSNRSFATAKFDPAGNELWAIQENGPDRRTGFGSQIAVRNGDVYITGSVRWAPFSTWFIKYGSLNQPPVANAGTYAPQECTGALTQVTLDGTASSDPNGDLLSFSWSGSFGVASGATAAVGLPLGNNPVTLTVDDGNGGTATASANILVQDTTPPLIDAGTDQVVIAQNAAGAPYTLNYGVSDACGGTNVTVSPLLASYPIGANVITATATDDSGNMASDAMTLTVAYASGDFLPPLKVNGLYKLGRTLPVKFQLFYADGSIVSTATPTLQLQQLSNNEPVGEPIDPQSSATAEPSNAFRFADDQYLYNLDTSMLSTGSYRLLVDLGDGNGYKTIDIGFK